MTLRKVCLKQGSLKVEYTQYHKSHWNLEPYCNLVIYAVHLPEVIQNQGDLIFNIIHNISISITIKYLVEFDKQMLDQWKIFSQTNNNLIIFHSDFVNITLCLKQQNTLSWKKGLASSLPWQSWHSETLHMHQILFLCRSCIVHKAFWKSIKECTRNSVILLFKFISKS